MASNPEQYDGALLAIIQNEGKVAPFIDVILGFLYRRTDFFRIMKKETDKLGFPPGVAFKLLENIFKKYEALAAQDYKKAEEMKNSREKMSGVPAMDSGRKSDVTPSSANSLSSDDKQKETLTECRAEVETCKDEPLEKRMKETQLQSTNQPGELKPSDQSSTAKPSENHAQDVDNEEMEDPEQARQRRELQANPLTYNGAEFETYYWSQTITEADLRVKVPKDIEKGKHVKVDIKKKHISVKVQASDGQWKNIVDDDLSWEIDPDAVWTLSPGEFVHINLEKKQERWWENVFISEPKINTRKIDCSRPMTELDDEAQAKIEEMMYNQRQKALGLPQSHETKTYEMLRKAWDAEGSPFKGQPFDPSKINVDANGIVNTNI